MSECFHFTVIVFSYKITAPIPYSLPSDDTTFSAFVSQCANERYDVFLFRQTPSTVIIPVAFISFVGRSFSGTFKLCIYVRTFDSDYAVLEKIIA